MPLSFFFSDFKMQQFIFLIAAGNAFSQAAHLHLQMQSKHDAATNFIDAGNAFKKADPQGKLYTSLWGIWYRLSTLVSFTSFRFAVIQAFSNKSESGLKMLLNLLFTLLNL